MDYFNRRHRDLVSRTQVKKTTLFLLVSKQTLLLNPGVCATAEKLKGY